MIADGRRQLPLGLSVIRPGVDHALYHGSTSSAKTCPSCGAKNRKPFYRKRWFYALIVLLVLGALGGGKAGSPAASGTPDTPPAASSASGAVSSESGTASGAASSEEEEPITYTHYRATELFDALNANALNASQTLKGQYVELEGYLNVIDSDGKYIGVGAASTDYDYLFQNVTCYLKSDDQRQQVAAMKTNEPITVCGKITDVGEVLGFYLNIDRIG